MVRTCFDSKVLSSSPSSSASSSDESASPSKKGYSIVGGPSLDGHQEQRDVPKIRPMTTDDFVLLDRLERRVDVQSFATVLKAYLIVRTRLAAKRADREFKRRRTKGRNASAGAEGSTMKDPLMPPKKVSSRVALLSSYKPDAFANDAEEHRQEDEKQLTRGASFFRRLWSFKKSDKEEEARPTTVLTTMSNSSSTSPRAAARAHVSYPKNVTAWETESSLLEQRLSFLGCRTVTSVGDGNCQFRSCSFSLFGNENEHRHVRRMAVAQMRKCRKDYEVFFDGAPLFDRYLRDMERSGTWGDELSLRAVADAFCCTIHLITSTPTSWYLRYDPERDGAKVSPQRHIFLTYISPIHYNAFYLKESAGTPNMPG
ncbi:OTU-like cysteine protease domain-containing protein, putative [Eimeria necatrix]|uniref:OTU-like cysteine protease domain-containing protein, putative n=1 Tax=Eimeria necatrix TaxID=51315 RepID=U6MPH8_9EIME|nr:OTU-like cysteine protease domain-containing protein, putative [Eimeria necatrix]CDJ63535.1 OTU-like cysteine protease domain-containing protein, putative [Eimeria necatrix]